MQALRSTCRKLTLAALRPQIPRDKLTCPPPQPNVTLTRVRLRPDKENNSCHRSLTFPL